MWSTLAIGVFALVYRVSGTSASMHEKATAVQVGCGFMLATLVLWLLDRVWFAPYIRVWPDRIEQVFPSGRQVSMRWGAIAEIRRNPGMQRLELRATSHDDAIRIEYQLEGFEEVHEALQRHATSARWH